MGDVSISPPSNDALNSHVAAVTSKIMLISMIVMFFLVAFCFFLCLYARWYWSRSEDSYVVSWRGVIARQGIPATQRRGLDRDTLGLLPVVVYDPKEFKEGMECSVCLSEVSQGEKVRVLPKCSHGFHLECIDMWFMSHSTCPLCRTSVISPKRQLSGCNQELPEVGANHGLSGSDSSSELESDSNAHSEEVMGLPANALLCGNEVEVRSLGEASGSSNRQRNELVIEIPRELCDDCSSSPPSTARLREEEVKTPVVSRLSSLKRMMSRGKRVAPSSSTDVGVELA